MKLQNFTNEELGTLRAQIDLEMASRESDSGYQESWLSQVAPTSDTSMLDNALFWDWKAYVRTHGRYIGPGVRSFEEPIKQ